jgi:hypothetical protein
MIQFLGNPLHPVSFLDFQKVESTSIFEQKNEAFVSLFSDKNEEHTSLIINDKELRDLQMNGNTSELKKRDLE